MPFMSTQDCKNDYRKVFCVFCQAGYEEKVAAEIMKKNDSILALPVLQEKHRSQNGVRTIVKQVMLPGYIFIFSNENISEALFLRKSKVLRFLKDTEGTSELYGDNLKYAQWVLKYFGIIRCSKAMRIGSRVKVVEGPLKEYEGYIKEISKKNRNGRVEMVFMGQLISVWLPFEWVGQNEKG